jgi:predicted lactoylglutathione lyase
VIFSLGVNTVADVDEMAKKAVGAGAKLYANPAYKDGWMYGCAFADLDGHRWNILFMDMSKMPKG